MIRQVILIFLAGILIDLLVARYTRAIADKKVWSATILSGLITLSTFFLLAVIIRENSMNSLLNICAYAGGNTIGTYLALKRPGFKPFLIRRLGKAKILGKPRIPF